MSRSFYSRAAALKHGTHRPLRLERLEARLNLSTNGLVSISGFGAVYRQDFDASPELRSDGLNTGGLGVEGLATGTALPLGWVSTTDNGTSAETTGRFPDSVVGVGTYNAGSGGDRALAIVGDQAKTLEFYMRTTDVAANAIRIRFNLELWGADPFVAISLAKASFTMRLDIESDGQFETLVELGESSTGMVLSPPDANAEMAVLDGNVLPNRLSIDSGVVEVNIEANSTVRLVLDAINTSTGYMVAVDDFVFRTLAHGDADGDGEIDFDDKVLLAGNLNLVASGATWRQGDFDADDDVDADDLRFLADSQRKLLGVLDRLFELRTESLELASDDEGRFIHDQGEAAISEAIQLGTISGGHDEALANSIKAEVAFRRSIIHSLANGLLPRAEMELAMPDSSISKEDFEIANNAFENLRVNSGELPAEELLVAVAEIRVRLAAVSGDGGPLPDLIVELRNYPDTSIRWTTPFPPVAGQPTTLRVNVRNIGEAAVKDEFDVALYVDEQLAKKWHVSPLEEFEGNPFYPGELLWFSHQVNFDGGSHTFRWFVDSARVIQESDETEASNVETAEETWRPISEFPDLIVESISHDRLVVGEVNTLSITIRNIGAMDIEVPFVATFQVNGRVSAGVEEFHGLPAGQSITFEKDWWDNRPSEDTFTVLVDFFDDVTEVEEDNNTSSKVLKTEIFTPDLEIKNLRIEPSRPEVHTPVKYVFDITNNGPDVVDEPFWILIMPGLAEGSFRPEYRLWDRTIRPGETFTLEHEIQFGWPHESVSLVVQLNSVRVNDPRRIFEEDTTNNTANTTFRVAESYWVELEIEPHRCGNQFDVSVNRSGGNYKGPVRIDARPAEIVGSTDHSRTYRLNRDRTVELEVYAVEDNRTIASTNPTPYLLRFRKHDRPRVTSISPTESHQRAEIDIVIRGSDFIDRNGTAVTVTFSDNNAPFRTESVTHNEIRGKLDLRNTNRYRWGRFTVTSECGGADDIGFGVFNPDAFPTVPFLAWFTEVLEPTNHPDSEDNLKFNFRVRNQGAWSDRFSVTLVLRGPEKESRTTMSFDPLDTGEERRRTWNIGKLKPGFYQIEGLKDGIRVLFLSFTVDEPF